MNKIELKRFYMEQIELYKLKMANAKDKSQYENIIRHYEVELDKLEIRLDDWR